jgi:FMN reductase
MSKGLQDRLSEPASAGPLVVGIGGSCASSSSSERVLRHILGDCERRGAETLALCAADLDLPVYTPAVQERSVNASSLLSALRRADAIVVVSPGYHGTLPGFLKNALDYAQDLVDDPRPYFEGRPVGLVAVAAGWQATGTTLSTLRFVTHALRGWPTPLGVTINSATAIFDQHGSMIDPATVRQLQVMVGQLLDFASRFRSHGQCECPALPRRVASLEQGTGGKGDVHANSSAA